MSMDAHSRNNSPATSTAAEVTTIVPALPLPRYPVLGMFGFGDSKRQLHGRDVDSLAELRTGREEEGTLDNDSANGSVAVLEEEEEMKSINGVQRPHHGELEANVLFKPEKSSRKAPTKSIWRNVKNLRSIEFGYAARSRNGVDPRVRGSGLGRIGGVRFGDVKQEEEEEDQGVGASANGSGSGSGNGSGSGSGSGSRSRSGSGSLWQTEDLEVQKPTTTTTTTNANPVPHSTQPPPSSASHIQQKHNKPNDMLVKDWDPPLYNTSATSPLQLQQQQQQQQMLSPELRPETEHHHHHHHHLQHQYFHPTSPITTPPPTAMSHGFPHQQAPPYYHMENRNFVVHGGPPGGRPYPTSPGFFPHNPAGYAGILPPSPHNHQQQQHEQSPQYPYHRPTDSISSSIDGAGGYQYPQHAPHTPHTPHMLPPPPPPHISHFPHLSPHPHQPYSSAPYPTGPPNSVHLRTPSLDPSNYITQNPQPLPPHYQNFPGSDHSRSGSSGHISPFPLPIHSFPPPNLQQLPSYRPSQHSQQASLVFQQFDGTQTLHHGNTSQDKTITNPLPGQEMQAMNNKNASNYILGQFGKPMFADITLNVAFSSPNLNQKVWHLLQVPFHTMFAGRIGILSKTLSKRDWAGPLEGDRLIKISLDDALSDSEGDVDKNVMGMMGNLKSFLTDTAVTIALVWAYGCSEQLVGDWFDMKTSRELEIFLSAVDVNKQPTPSPSSASAEGVRGSRSTAPSPEPVKATKSSEHTKPQRVAPRDWADDYGDDSEDEDTHVHELERDLSNSETQATTPHHETSPGKAFTDVNAQTIWSSERISSYDATLKRILSVMSAAVILDIPDLVDFCENELSTYINSEEDMVNLTSGLNMFDMIIPNISRISPFFTDGYSRRDHRFDSTYERLIEAVSVLTRKLIGSSSDRLESGSGVEEQYRRLIKKFSSEFLIRTALDLVDGMPHLQSLQDKIHVLQQILCEETYERNLVVGTRFGSDPKLERGNRIQFGDFEGVGTRPQISVGKRVGKKWIWIDSESF